MKSADKPSSDTINAQLVLIIATIVTVSVLVIGIIVVLYILGSGNSSEGYAVQLFPLLVTP